MIKSVSIVSMKDYETQINGQVCKILTRNIWSINYQNFSFVKLSKVWQF